MCIGERKSTQFKCFFFSPLAEGSVFSAVVENFGWSIKIFYRFSDMSSYLACLNIRSAALSPLRIGEHSDSRGPEAK